MRICLIVKGQDDADRIQEKIDNSSTFKKKIVDLEFISLTELRKGYSRYNKKRELCDRFDLFSKIKHIHIFGGDILRRPIYSSAIFYYKLRGEQTRLFYYRICGIRLYKSIYC